MHDDDYNRSHHRGNRGGGRRDGGRRDGNRRGLPLSELDPKLTEQSRLVIGGSIEVHKSLGPGFDKDVYQKALEIELEEADLDFERDKKFPITYLEENIGECTAGLFVGGRFLVEVLARPGEVTGLDRLVMRSRLRVADLELGLIINFAERRLKDGLVRVLNPEKLGLTKKRDDEDEYEEYEDEDEGVESVDEHDDGEDED